jgi:hypothetical protein
MLHFGRAACKFCILMLSVMLIVVCSMCLYNGQVSRRHLNRLQLLENIITAGRAHIFKVGEFFYNPEALVIGRLSARIKFRCWRKEVARVQRGVRECKYRIKLSFLSSEDIKTGYDYDVTSKNVIPK